MSRFPLAGSPAGGGAGGGLKLTMKADKANHWGYNPQLQPFASSLRHRMTKAEIYLWKYALRSSGVKGYPFRRQRPVLNYIADFMCKNLNLIIEVDGASHDLPGAAGRDAIRQQRLEEAGFKVIRFTDDEVHNKMETVVKKIVSVIEEIEKTGGIVIPLRQRGISSRLTPPP